MVKMKNLGISKKKKKNKKSHIVDILKYFLTDRIKKIRIGNNYSEIEYTFWCSSEIKTKTFMVQKY